MDAKELFQHWSDVRCGLLEALDKLTEDQLAFTSHPNLWSLGQTVCHIAGAEEGWFRHVVTHELSGWGDADFKSVDYPTLADVKKLITEVHERTEQFFSIDADAMLERIIPLPWGSQASLGWIVWHVLEHEIHHRGEVFLMLGMLGLEAPDV